MTLTVIIQIYAIDAVHVFVADILAHSRQDGLSHVMVIEIHNLTICIFVNRISPAWAATGLITTDERPRSCLCSPSEDTI